MASTGVRQDQYSISVHVDGVPEMRGVAAIWDKLAGGVADSEETVYKPGAMGERESLGGFPTVTNVTVTRNFKTDRDLPLRPKLLAARGKSAATVTKQSLDKAGRPVGKPLVYKGTLKAYTDPEADSTSVAAGLVEMEITSATVS